MPLADPRVRRWRAWALWPALLLCGFLPGCRQPASPPPGSRRLAIVAVDGATWRVISPMMEKGELPRLSGLYRRGSAGLLRSVEPMLPAALWTTVATGMSRGTHGIERASERIPGRYTARPLTADRRRVPALWSIAGARGLTVGVSGWDLTFPAEQVNGYLIAQAYEPGVTGDHGYLHPQGALGETAGVDERLRLSDAAQRVAALDGETRASFDRDLAALSCGLTLYRVYQPRLAFFRFSSIDLVSHRFWQYHEPRYLELAASRGVAIDARRAADLAAALPGAYAVFDEWLGLLLERLPAGSTILLISDHGFRGVDMTDYLHVDLNWLLERLGFLTFGGGQEPDWKRTQAFTLDDVGGMRRPIYLNLKGREEQGLVDPAGAVGLKLKLAETLRGLESHLGGPLFRTVTVDDAPGPGEPDLTVVENMAIDPHGEVLLGDRRQSVASLYRRYGEDFGAHDPEGMLLAAGDGIVVGRTGWTADLQDVAPTVLRLMGLPAASDMPGRMIVAILQGSGAGSEGALVPTYTDLPPAPSPMKRPAALADEELRRLRALGHLR